MSHEPSVTELAGLPRSELKALWVTELGAAMPKRISRLMMARVLINTRQWTASGQSRDKYLRQLNRLVAADKKNQPVARSGTRLIREWNGRRHVVDVVSDGYLWNGRTWRSLSAIAKEITGTKWSGPRFFGVAV